MFLYLLHYLMCFNQRAVERGATVVQEPSEFGDDDGKVRFCVIQTYGDTTHTLYDLSGYKGLYLPGYRAVDPTTDPLVAQL